MTILQSLYRYYGRMERREEADPYGYTRENISFCVTLSVDGTLLDVTDMRTDDNKKRRPIKIPVPQPKRTSNTQSNFLWDKTSYAFGVDTGKSKRLDREHDAFRQFHFELLGDLNTPHARAFLSFYDAWRPQRFGEAPFNDEMRDHSFVFRIEGEHSFLHEVDALRSVWLKYIERDMGSKATEVLCLVSGKKGLLEVGHPVLKGVSGAQSSGAYLVSFNAPAFTSYGARDGANAPTSKEAAFRYGAALNRMLDRDSRNRLSRPIGDATVVFWADTSDTVREPAAQAAEALFFEACEPAEGRDDDKQEAVKLRDALEAVAAGRPKDVNPAMEPGTRFHVLGLAPNAARLAVRYWLDDSFAAFAARLLEHQNDLRIEPKPHRWGEETPSVNRLLVKTTALQEKFDNVPQLLAGEVMRAVLAGTRYPRTWLAAAIIRLRAGDDPSTGWHAAAIRAVLERDRRWRSGSDAADRGTEVPMSLARESKDEAYQLGRLFAALETAQRLALGRVNATIRDRYFGAASATPATVFPLLLRGVQNHIAKLRKEGKGGWIEREIGEIVDRLPERLPRSLKLDAQGRFAIGFYHQRQAQFATRPAVSAAIDAEDGEQQEDEIDGNG